MLFNRLTEKIAVIHLIQQRVRPILLTTATTATTATTVGSMLLLWFSVRPMFLTMAIAVIFWFVSHGYYIVAGTRAG